MHCYIPSCFSIFDSRKGTVVTFVVTFTVEAVACSGRGAEGSSALRAQSCVKTEVSI